MLIFGILTLSALGAGAYRFYPALSGVWEACLSLPLYIVYGGFMLLPALWEIWGRIAYARAISRAFPFEKETTS